MAELSRWFALRAATASRVEIPATSILTEAEKVGRCGAVEAGRDELSWTNFRESSDVQ
jgi:hypothetical protein